jgi:hypothetical protein
MKFFGFAIAMSLAVTQSIQKMSVECGEGLVPTGGKGVCI